jgi:hypothetical protein
MASAVPITNGLRAGGKVKNPCAAKEGLGFSKVVKKGKWVTARGGWFEDLA